MVDGVCLAHYSEQIFDLIDKYYKGIYIEDIGDGDEPRIHVDYVNRSELDGRICALLIELLSDYNNYVMDKIEK